MTPMLAFHNDPAVKAKYLARVRRHRKAGAAEAASYLRQSVKLLALLRAAPVSE